MKIRTIIKPVLLLMAFINNADSEAQIAEIKQLDAKQQSIIRIASVTAVGDLAKLNRELNSGLDAGLTINQAKEVLLHLYAYCGFPRSIRGLQTLIA